MRIWQRNKSTDSREPGQHLSMLSYWVTLRRKSLLWHGRLRLFLVLKIFSLDFKFTWIRKVGALRPNPRLNNYACRNFHFFEFRQRWF